MRFDLPALTLDSGDVVRRVTVRRGIGDELMQQLADAGPDLLLAATDIAGEATKRNESIAFEQTEVSARMNYKDLYFSEIEFD